MTSAIVRLAGSGDEEPLYSLLIALALDNNSFGYELSEKMIREHIRMGTEHKGGIYGVVDGKDGILAGGVGIIWDRYWFTERFHLAQTFFIVRPEYRRGTGIAAALMVWMEDLRKMIERDAGYPVALINAVASEKRLEAKRRWWRRAGGGREIGAIFKQG